MQRFLNYSGHDFARIAALAGVYALAAKLVLDFFSVNQLVSVIWPGSGIALAVLLLCGWQFWPGVFIGALAGNIWAGAAYPLAFFVGIGNTLEALCGYYLLRGMGNALQQPQQYLYLLFAGGLAACLSALSGSAGLLYFGVIASQDWTASLLHWWMGDVLGIAIVTPLILVWRKLPVLDWSFRQTGLPALCLLAAFLAGQMIFLEWPANLGDYRKAYYMFAFLACGMLRPGLHVTLLVIGMVMLQSMFSVILKVGYFGNVVSETGLILQWSYLLVMASVGIPMALAIEQHKRSEQSANAVSKFNRQILQSLQEGWRFTTIMAVSSYGTALWKISPASSKPNASANPLSRYFPAWPKRRFPTAFKKPWQAKPWPISR